MTDYSTMTLKEIDVVLRENPTETPHYIKAKEEREYRLKKWGLYFVAAGLLLGLLYKLL